MSWSKVGEILDEFVSDLRNQTRKREDMGTKNLFVVTMPATVSVLVEAGDEKDAKASAVKTAESVLGKSLGVLHVVGDAKATAVSTGKKAKAEPEDDDEDEEKDEEEEEEDEEEDEEESSDDEEEEEEDEEEEEEEEEEAPKKKKKSSEKPDKSDKKSSDKKDGGKKKIKIKLKG